MSDAKNPGQVSAYLDEWTLKQIKAYADAEDRSVSWVVGFAVKQFFVALQGKPDLSRAAGAALKRDPTPDYAKLAGRQVHLEDAIAAVVKRGPSKVAKHK